MVNILEYQRYWPVQMAQIPCIPTLREDLTAIHNTISTHEGSISSLYRQVAAHEKEHTDFQKAVFADCTRLDKSVSDIHDTISTQHTAVFSYLVVETRKRDKFQQQVEAQFAVVQDSQNMILNFLQRIETRMLALEERAGITADVILVPAFEDHATPEYDFLL
jgi:hypothetical protein